MKEPDTSYEITILGQGPGWEQYPYDQETWTLNMALFKAKRVDKLFLIDPIETKTDIRRGYYHGFYKEYGKTIPVNVDDFKKKIIDNKISFVSGYEYKDIPTYEPYPIKEILEMYKVPYFANTISYMIAYALLKKVTLINFWGVNQAAASEFIMHKGCIEFWIGLAIGLGVGIRINGAHSHVLRNPDGLLYGYRMEKDQLLQHLKEHGELKYKPLEKRKKSVVSI